MGKPCKHGHVDGVRHIPCPKCRIEYLEGKLEGAKEAMDALEHIGHLTTKEDVWRYVTGDEFTKALQAVYAVRLYL